MWVKGDYLTIEEYRQKIGFTSNQPLYRAIREGRLEHIRRFNRILIPKNAVLKDRRIKDGRYIGFRQWVERQVSNIEELPYIVEKRKGLSTPRKDDDVDTRW